MDADDDKTLSYELPTTARETRIGKLDRVDRWLAVIALVILVGVVVLIAVVSFLYP